MSIIGTLPQNIQNGTVEDATQVMANFNWILNQVNANAAQLSLTPQLGSANTFTQPITAANAITGAQLPTASQIQNNLGYAIDTGTANTYVVSPTITYTSYSEGQEIFFRAITANTGASTLQVNGLTAVALTNPDGTALSASQIKVGTIYLAIYNANSTRFELGFSGPNVDANPLLKNSSDPTKLVNFSLSNLTTATTRTLSIQDKNIIIAGLADINGGSNLGSKIQPITASVASNALTITLNPTTLDFRSSTLGSGTVNTRTIAAAISVVVPSTATLGTVNAIQNRLAVLAIDNSGTIELAVVNMAGGNDLSETGLISTTAIAAASNSASTIYSTTARTSVPYRVVGYVESTQTTAGTWATAPSTIQGVGGQALAALSSLGYGQIWQSVTRTSGTTYYNTTGKPIFVAANQVGLCTITINGVAATMANNAQANQVTFIVPPNSSYSITSGTTIVNVSELR